MRASLRLLTPRLPAFTPTGLTGVLTHPHPRPTLIALYNHTLSVLSQLPSSSVYRTATENLTKARLDAVQSAVPPGYDEFMARAREINLVVAERPYNLEEMGLYIQGLLQNILNTTMAEGNRQYALQQMKHWRDVDIPLPLQEPPKLLPEMTLDQATATTGDVASPPPTAPPPGQISHAAPEESAVPDPSDELLMEPQLTLEQVSEVEAKINDGLIEEVVEQGWAELKCAEMMLDSKAWEALEVEPEPGQWAAFERTPEGPSRS